MAKFNQSFRGMRQDFSENTSNGEYYYEARNLTIYPSNKSRLGGIGNIKSNKKLLRIDYVYDSLESSYINGGIEIDNNAVVIFSTHVAYFGSPITNKITKVTGDSQEVIFSGDLGISKNDKLTILHNPETESVNKLYWSNEGKQQIRSINLNVDNSTKTADQFNIIPTVEFNAPTVSIHGWGGTHTSGMIQYAYSYFNYNGQESKISPLTNLISLTKANGQGGDINQVVGQINKLQFTNLDLSYDYIKVYSIKYNTKDEEPIISVINESSIDESLLTVVDDGTVIYGISTEQFTFLGGEVFYPKSIEIKDNRLFAANISETVWDVDLDCRAYRADHNGVQRITNYSSGLQFVPDDYDIPEEHDCIQNDYDVHKYTKSGSTYGAEGKYIKLEFENIYTTSGDLSEHRVYKLNEVYRFGLVFYNKYGESSAVKWICDYKMDFTEGLFRNYYVPKIIISTAGQSLLSDAGVVSYTLVRVERDVNNKSVLFQGIATPTMMKVPLGDLSNTHNNLFETGNATDPAYLSANHSLGYQNREEALKDSVIYPSLISRDFVDLSEDSDNTIIKKMKHLQSMNGYTTAGKSGDDVYGQLSLDSTIGEGNYFERAEVNHSISVFQTDDSPRTMTFQNTKVWQISSPELLFDEVKIPEGAKLRLFKIHEKITNNISVTGNEYISGNDNIYKTATLKDRLRFERNTSDYLWHRNGLIGSYLDERVTEYIYKRGLSELPTSYRVAEEFDIYGQPLILDKGASATAYNNDYRFKISNSLYKFSDDLWKESERILGTNSEGCKSCFVIPINPNASLSLEDDNPLKHLRLEDAVNQVRPSTLGKVADIIVEIYLPLDKINLYGGNTYEARSRNSYIAVSDAKDLDYDDVHLNTGDTYLQPFCFQRLSNGTMDYSNPQITSHSEIIDTVVESSINLNRRNDLTSSLDNSTRNLGFNYYHRDISNFSRNEYDVFHKYNTAYSRQGNIIKFNPKNFLLKINENFPNTIRASEIKIAGETIDSFTNFLVNEETVVGAKYGEITKIHSFNDSMYVFTPESVFYLTINPRVQTVADDGLSIELGTGTLFGKDKALTTESGLSFKDVFSVSNSPVGIYYFDRNNITICKVTDRVEGISSTKGNYITLQNAFVDNELGVISGYEPHTNSLYMTIPTDSGRDTILFSEAYDEFISWIDMSPHWYFNGRTGLYTINAHAELWRELEGSDFGSINTKNLSPEIEFIVKTNNAAVYTSVEWKSVISGVNNKTFDKIRVSHEDQDSGLVNIKARNKFNKFRVNIPRHANNHFGNRIFGKWIRVNLSLTDDENREFILHELQVNYQDKI